MLKSTPNSERRQRSQPADDATSETAADENARRDERSANDSLPLTSDVSAKAPQRLISLFVWGEARVRLTRAVQAGAIRQVAQADVLAESRLPALAVRSFWLLIGSAALLSSLISLARYFAYSGTLLGDGNGVWRFFLFLLANIAAYIIMIPLHEGVHALAILAQGGRPRFGLRLPIAAYCTAPNQLFTRNGYLVVALAPLVALTLAGLVVIWLAPNVGACVLLGIAGNISGAVGDLAVVNEVRRLPPHTLIADTETGYIAYSVER